MRLVLVNLLYGRKSNFSVMFPTFKEVWRKLSFVAVVTEYFHQVWIHTASARVQQAQNINL